MLICYYSYVIGFFKNFTLTIIVPLQDKMFLVINDAGEATTFSLEPSDGGYKLGSDSFASLDEVVKFMKKRALPAKRGGNVL